MSVDKFGRFSGDLVNESKIKRGPPGVGFKLTEDGNFNINNKRLCNVGDPESEDEAVNLKYMKTNVITLINNSFNADKKSISNLGDPQYLLDAVNKSYVDKRIPTKVKTSAAYSFENNRLIQVAPPINKLDAVNLDYMRQNTIKLTKDGYFDADNRIIERLPSPKHPRDVANKIYVDDKLPIYCFDEKLQQSCCDFKKARLINVSNPIDSTDVVNVQTLQEVKQVIRRDYERYINNNIYYTRRKEDNSLDFKEARLTNIGIPENDNDAVTKNYLHKQLNIIYERLISCLYSLYKKMAKDEPIINKEHFVRTYIQQED